MTDEKAREDFMNDVYNTLDFLPTNNEANRIIDSFDRVTSELEQQPCEDWYDVPSNEMTLEQARQAVKDLRKKLAEYLEQQPCEDAVSRQAVEKMIKAEMPERGMWEIEGDIVKDTVCEVCADLMQELSKLPPVTPKEKSGRWIGHREHCENLEVMPSGLGAYEWCSNCDCGIDVREWHRNNYNFCPNCGARMVSE